MTGKVNKKSKKEVLGARGEAWVDSFHIEAFDLAYRKDKYGIWYDAEGIRMSSSFFLKDDVLISLNAKKTLQSVSFKNQVLYVSAYDCLIQVGKIVFTKDLTPLNLLGSKVTGIGTKVIEFSEDDIIQEVNIGSVDIAYINLLTGKPYLIDNEVVRRHHRTINKRSDRFEIFETESQRYWLKDKSTNVLRLDGNALDLDDSSLMTLKGRLVAKVSNLKSRKSAFYVDVDKLEIFVIDAISKEQIVHIDKRPEIINEELLYNIKTENDVYVYNVNKGELYNIENLETKHFQFGSLTGFEVFFCTLYVGADNYIFNKNTKSILKIEGVTISNITSHANMKLLNAFDFEGQRLVLDARRGIENCSIARSLHTRIHQAKGKPFSISNKILQKVQIETLGGQIDRIVNLDKEDLDLFLLPSDLKVYPEQDMISGYAERAIVDVSFNDKLFINNKELLLAKFESFTGELLPFVLQSSNGRPLHIVGDGHRNELVSTVNQGSIKTAPFIADHQMISATTLSEDGKNNQLLFSAKELNSWLAFHEGYLPILKKVLELKGGMWEYNLFELRESRGEAEYLVVEKRAPYRLLVENKAGKHSPKIVKRGSAELKVPEQISRLKKLFVEDPGYLVTLE